MKSDIFDRLAMCETLDSLWQTAVDHWVATGFERVAYYLLRRGQPEGTVAVFRRGQSYDISHHYEDMGHARHDPAARYALTTGRPLLVDRLPELVTFNRAERKVFNDLQAAGAKNVLLVPLFGPQVINGLLAVASTVNPGILDEVNYDEMQSVAQIMHLRMISKLPESPVMIANPLSDRELETLRWVAQGKSNAVIAEILEISGGTVDTYLRRIFEKLGVADRTAAAVRGVSYGYIQI